MSNQKIKINYLYRDASNYKLFASKLFSNTTNLSLETIKEKIESRLIDGEYFSPENWDFKQLKFEEIDIEDDHDWHEIENIELSTDEVEPTSDITDLLLKLEFENILSRSV